MTSKRYNRAMKAHAVKKAAKEMATLMYETDRRGWRVMVDDPIATGVLERALTSLLRHPRSVVVMQMSEREGKAFPSQRDNEPGGSYALAIALDPDNIPRFKIAAISSTLFLPPSMSEDAARATRGVMTAYQAARAEDVARAGLASIMAA
jgi:hypothetical protein